MEELDRLRTLLEEAYHIISEFNNSNTDDGVGQQVRLDRVSDTVPPILTPKVSQEEVDEIVKQYKRYESKIEALPPGDDFSILERQIRGARDILSHGVSTRKLRDVHKGLS
jgi:hypothetical protein